MDALSYTDSFTYLNQIARSNSTLVSWFTQQAPAHIRFRFDRTKFLESFSAIVDGKRISAMDWEQGPGRTGSDVEIGKEYPEPDADLSPQELYNLWATDSPTPDEPIHPFNNSKPYDQRMKWIDHRIDALETIPLAEVNEEIALIKSKADLSYSYLRTSRRTSMCLLAFPLTSDPLTYV